MHGSENTTSYRDVCEGVAFKAKLNGRSFSGLIWGIDKNLDKSSVGRGIKDLVCQVYMDECKGRSFLIKKNYDKNFFDKLLII